MKGFKSIPPFKEVGVRRFELLEDLIYETEAGSLYVVPAGFVTDWASIPRVFWLIVSPFECVPEATLHDYLYWLRGGDPYLVTREQADMRFLVTLRDRRDLPEWKCVGMWRAVRWFGGIGWARKPEPIGGPFAK